MQNTQFKTICFLHNWIFLYADVFSVCLFQAASSRESLGRNPSLSKYPSRYKCNEQFCCGMKTLDTLFSTFRLNCTTISNLFKETIISKCLHHVFIMFNAYHVTSNKKPHFHNVEHKRPLSLQTIDEIIKIL